jgi:hypothetical protein
LHINSNHNPALDWLPSAAWLPHLNMNTESYLCVCGRIVPTQNRTVHELRCTPIPEQVQEQITDPGHSTPIGTASTMEPGEWECGACTYRNKSDRESCEICLTQDPSFIPPPLQTVTARLIDDPVEQDSGRDGPLEGELPLDSLAGSMVLGAGIGPGLAWMNNSNQERGALAGASIGFMGNLLLRELVRNDGADGAGDNWQNSQSLAEREWLPQQARRPSSSSTEALPAGDQVGDYAAMDDFMRGMLRQRMIIRGGSRGEGFGDRDMHGLGFEQLLERFPSPDRPVDTRILNRLPEHIFRGGEPGKTPDACSICLETFRDLETLRTLPCCHLFHKGCVDSWLAQSHTCPICKYNINNL